MEIEDVRAIIKAALPDLWVGAYKIDAGRDEAACVYRRKGLSRKAVGGEAGYGVLPVSALVRGGARAGAAVRLAAAVFDAMADAKLARGFARTGQDAPIALGTDEKGVYEFTIDVDFYYEVESKNEIESNNQEGEQ